MLLAGDTGTRDVVECTESDSKREARICESPVCVTSFGTASDDALRDQFILVDSTTPLSKG
jgi:hypothetical protein